MKSQIFSIILAVAPTIATAVMGYVTFLFKTIVTSNKRTDKALSLLLRIDLERMFDNYKAKGSITIDELNDFDEVYAVYTSLGGNGKGTTMHNKVHEMEIK